MFTDIESCSNEWATSHIGGKPHSSTQKVFRCLSEKDKHRFEALVQQLESEALRTEAD